MAGDDVVDIVLEGESWLGAEGGFFQIRRTVLRNRRDDGTVSEAYPCEFVVRPKGPDAVVVALYHRGASGRTRVLVREGLRPALWFGRAAEDLPIPDDDPSFRFTEVVAGILEEDDRGEAGIRRRAAIEVVEEAGYRVEPDAVVFLGAGTFPTPGSMPEKFWLTAVEIVEPTERDVPTGDGSPMEEGVRLRWLDLEEAIEACTRGVIADAKSELAFRRLSDRLSREG